MIGLFICEAVSVSAFAFLLIVFSSVNVDMCTCNHDIINGGQLGGLLPKGLQGKTEIDCLCKVNWYQTRTRGLLTCSESVFL